MTKRYLSLLACLAVVGLPSAALPQPIGPEFQVNTYTASYQSLPSVASDASGKFVVVWQSFSQDRQYTGIFGQRYDSDGNPLGREFQVNTYTTRPQWTPSVSSDANGNFVVVWDSQLQEPNGGSGEAVIGQRYDSNGNPLGGEFQVNTYTLADQYHPAVSSDGSGNFVVVWVDRNPTGDGQDGSRGGIFGQRYDSEGNPLGGEFQVNTYTTNNQSSPSVASDASGNFVVVWESNGQDGQFGGIFGQRYDRNGNPLDSEFQVNTYTTSLQSSPAVASDVSGGFVAVWEGVDQNGFTDVFGQRYDSNGTALGEEFQVNTHTTSSQFAPAIASDVSGNFVVVWQSRFQDGGGGGEPFGVFGQRYDSRGERTGSEFLVNTYTTDNQNIPAVAADAGGNFVVVWESKGQDGSDYGIFGQRFATGCEASLQVKGGVNTPGTIVPVQVHIAHHRPKTVTVRWKLSLLDASGQIVARHISPPHTFEPGDVLNQEVNLRLPEDLASGEYTLDLAVKRMAGTQGAKTIIRVVRAE